MARKTITKLVICVKRAAQVVYPKMADLPACRVQQNRRFTHVGVDYVGLFVMKEIRLRKVQEYKVYLAVFICTSIKAVNLEVVSDLSTNAFLEAFNRFIFDIRSTCIQIVVHILMERLLILDD